jgi:6-phosphogluconolactonase
MKTSLAFFTLPLLLAAVCAAADTAEFYIGAYTNPGGSRGIQRGSLDTKTGELKLLGVAGEARNPSFLAVHPNGKSLYAAIEIDGGAVTAFAVEKDGSLRKLNTESSRGSGNCFVSVDPSGRNVFAANYGDGSIACLPIRDDGSVAPASASVKHKGKGPITDRQDGPHAHALYANGAFAYACDLGTDDVFVYRFDAASGTLTPNDPPSAKVPAGGGPRHLAFHPKGGFAYVNDEITSAVTVFAHDAAKGTLAALQTISTLPDGYPDARKNSTAEIFCHPNGRFLYVSNRVHDSVAVFAIGGDGKLTVVQYAPAGVKIPRGFALAPDGEWLVVAGQDSNSIASHRIDPATGKLTPAATVGGVGAPVCIVFAAAK